jgi:hypothetical protein
MKTALASVNLVASVYCVLLCAVALVQLEKPSLADRVLRRNRRVTGDYLAFIVLSLGCACWVLFWGSEASRAAAPITPFSVAPESVYGMKPSFLMCDLNSIAMAGAAYFLLKGWWRRISKLTPLIFAGMALLVCLGAANQYLATVLKSPITTTMHTVASIQAAFVSTVALAVALYLRSRNLAGFSLLFVYALLQYPAINALATPDGQSIIVLLLALMKPGVVLVVFRSVSADQFGAASSGSGLRKAHALEVFGWLLSIAVIGGTYMCLEKQAFSPERAARITVSAIVAQICLFMLFYYIAALRGVRPDSKDQDNTVVHTQERAG